MTYSRSNAGAAALAFARQLTGRPYVYGGTWPESGGTDCAGLTQWAYGEVGVSLPRTTEEQYLLYRIPETATSEPGDLLFIAGDPIDANPGHVMIYVSPGQVFEAEETGTLIGQFAYDTSVYEFRTRPALALPPEEDDMKAIIASGSKGGEQIIAADCQTKVPCPEGDVATVLLASGNFVDLRGKLDPTFVDSIPVST